MYHILITTPLFLETCRRIEHQILRESERVVDVSEVCTHKRMLFLSDLTLNLHLLSDYCAFYLPFVNQNYWGIIAVL